jgi:hypothetical protein
MEAVTAACCCSPQKYVASNNADPRIHPLEPSVFSVLLRVLGTSAK